MKHYSECTSFEKNIIRKAFEYELKAIAAASEERNPYSDVLQIMGLWEVFNQAISMAFAAQD